MDEWEPVRQRARKCSREEEQCVRPQHPEETPEGWCGSVWYVSRGGGVLVVPGETRSTWTRMVAVGHGRGQPIWQGVESLINKVK